jgi:Ca2+-binding EF-hand superfamily protein
MKNTSMILAAAAALMATSVAFAAPPSFKKADANGDGVVDAAEFEATKSKKKFASLDKNGDGTLDKKEYSVLLDEDCE